MRQKLVIATHNPAKLRELRRLLASLDLETVLPVEAGHRDEPEESADDYAGNALGKAAAATRATGLPALGEDSGIEVVALHGWPGPGSARWLGPSTTDADRLRALIDEVARRSPDDRRVRYVAAVALTRPGFEPVLAHGRCDGTLVEPRGSNGFGYDPGFLSTDLGVRLAEVSDQEKDSVSHRGRAVRRLIESGALDPPADHLPGQCTG